MAIPKIIHYCWFGHGSKSELMKKCIASWKKICPDYKIVEWNEDNYDVSAAPLYVRQAFEAKKWAFVTDYIRLQVVYEYGGIYMDTDVELKKSLDDLVKYSAYFGLESAEYINLGVGFGSEKKMEILSKMLELYQNIPFILEDGTYDLKPSPQRVTDVFANYGLVKEDRKQMLNGNICILPSIVLSPLDYNTGKMRKSGRTISIHWYTASWRTQEEKEYHERHLQAVARDRKDYWIHMPNRVAKSMIGEKRYGRLKRLFKK